MTWNIAKQIKKSRGAIPRLDPSMAERLLKLHLSAIYGGHTLFKRGGSFRRENFYSIAPRNDATLAGAHCSHNYVYPKSSLSQPPAAPKRAAGGFAYLVMGGVAVGLGFACRHHAAVLRAVGGTLPLGTVTDR